MAKKGSGDTKNKILKAAFSEWGKIKFHNTSLSLINKKLGISKAALYRYFKNKADLINVMNDYYSELLFKLGESFLKEAEKLDPMESLKLYVDKYINYFMKNKNYSLFFLNLFDKERAARNKLLGDIFARQVEFFKSKMGLLNRWVPESRIAGFYNHAFWAILYSIHYKLESGTGNSSLKDINSETVYKMIVDGFGKNIDIINFEDVEKVSVIDNTQLVQRDKIVDAIADVVAEEGLWNTSTDKIAAKLGMSKSSLYFYFKNKNEMIYKSIVEQLEKMTDLYLEAKGSFDSFEEVLYCNMVVKGTYLKHDDKFIEVFNWLNNQDNEFDKRMREYKQLYAAGLGFMVEGIEAGKIETYGMDAEFIVGFLNSQVIKELITCKLNNQEFTVDNLRLIYNLFFHGIKGR